MRRPRSLAHGVPCSRTGTLHASSATCRITAAPAPGLVVRFGRGERPETDLRVGGDDRRVSRRQGELTFYGGRWWLRNTGQGPLRLPGGEPLCPLARPLPLADGYTPVFVRGSGYREYLVELYVSGGVSGARHARPLCRLSDDERLLLVVLGQRYLRCEPRPRPLPRRAALHQLRFLRPQTDWESPGIDARTASVAARLAAEAGTPASLHDLLTALVTSATLVPTDLALLDRELPG